MRTRVPLSRLIIGLAAALALTACGGGGEDSGDSATVGQGNTISLEAGDMYYDPDSVAAGAGSITFEMENVGGVKHTLLIESTGETVIEVTPGETATGTTDLEAGSYTFYCDVPGHREAGMEGTLEVS